MQLVLAEDNEVTRRILTAALARVGHDVIGVADGAAAVDAAARLQPPLVILDWEMPVIDGVEACRRIRALPSGIDCFILMITGREGPGDLVTALHAGVDDYVAKPVTPEHIEARLLIAERRISVNRARRQAEEAVARARWLSGIGETALALQHEINNPLTSLLAEAQMLELNDSLAPDVAEGATAIVAAARRVAAVVRRLAQVEDPRSVEYTNGARMLDLAPTASSR